MGNEFENRAWAQAPPQQPNNGAGPSGYPAVSNIAGYPPPGGNPSSTYGFGGAPPPDPKAQQPYGAAPFPPPQPQGYPPQGGYPPQQPPSGLAYHVGPMPAAPPPLPAAMPPGAIGGGATAITMDPDVAADTAFASIAVRNGFVRKVFGIVAVQLAVTVGVALMCLYVQPINTYVRVNAWPLFTAWGFALFMMLVLACVPSARRKYPLNLGLLAAFTLAEAFLVGMITAFHNIEAVMLAFLVTAVVVTGVTIFAMNTKVDVTRWGTVLGVAGLAFMVLIFVGMFWINKILYLVIAGVASVLFTIYLIYDIQLVMGGKTYSISPDEYIFAALNIYIDIIMIFTNLLAIIGFASNN